MSEKPSPANLTAAIGTHVVIELLDAAGETERLEFDIVPDQIADFSRGYLGQGTPLARAILDQSAGTLLPYLTEDTTQVHILSVEVARALPAGDAASPRQETMRKVKEQVEHTNAILFASSYSSKWGDYDPGGVDHWNENEESEQDHQ
jgi:hypothetical protein